MNNTIITISPISNEVCYELVETRSNFINEKLDKMVLAQKKWAKISLEKRISIIQEFIHKVLESKTLELSEKKQLILSIINMTRKGDETGSQVLKMYYDFIDNIMN